MGWNNMSNNKAAKARFYEYGTKNSDSTTVDLSGRVENSNGVGTVLDEWQILEFNPRNYFNNSYWIGKNKGEWDLMGFTTTLSAVDNALTSASINVPSGETTEATLPISPKGITYKWVSSSNNTIVSQDGTKLTVVRPAAGQGDISTTITLYAMNSEGSGDKKGI